MELKGLVLFSEEPVIGLYPEPDESNQRSATLFP
jgi:hypothetical protein